MTTIVATETSFARATLADIAAALPGATRIFRSSKLDFCCGGQISLADAALAKGLRLPELEADLAAIAAMGLPVERPGPTDQLIGFIETRYHAAHRDELPELIRLARRVEAVHKTHPAAPLGLTKHLETLAKALEAHMLKEEQVLFPLMRGGDRASTSQVVAALVREHDDHGVHLREIERLTADFTLPSDACPTWRALYVSGKKFVDDIMEHVHIENAVLFPRFISAQ